MLSPRWWKVDEKRQMQRWQKKSSVGFSWLRLVKITGFVYKSNIQKYTWRVILKVWIRYLKPTQNNFESWFSACFHWSNRNNSDKMILRKFTIVMCSQNLVTTGTTLQVKLSATTYMGVWVDITQGLPSLGVIFSVVNYHIAGISILTIYDNTC